MHALLLFLAFFGLVYGLFALHTMGFSGPSIEEEMERDAQDIHAKAAGRGLEAFAFRVGRPLHWFVMLPLKSPGAALYVAFLMVLPAIVF
jgi:hypothetical protein